MAPSEQLKKEGDRRAGAKLDPRMARIAKKALTATPEEVASYRPRGIDIKVAEAIIQQGCSTSIELGKELRVGESHVRQVLSNPVRMAWILDQVDKGIKFRLPLIRAGMYMKARRGDVRAAEILLKHFEQDQPQKHLHLHSELGIDPTSISRMSDSDLDVYIKSKGVQLPGEAADDETNSGDSSGT